MTKKESLIPILSRQPIFKKDNQVYAYSFSIICPEGCQNEEECFTQLVSEKKSMDLLSDLSAEKPIKISLSKDILNRFEEIRIPSDKIIIDINSEGIENNNLQNSLKKLKNYGFMLSTSYSEKTKNSDKYSLFDIISIDFRKLATSNPLIKNRNQLQDKELLALSVETDSDLESASKSGGTYFQGNFFIRPALKALNSIPVNKMNQMEILKLINNSEINFTQIEKILERDVSLTYKLLSFINSANFGVKREVNSIPHALNLMGEKEVRKWLSISVMGEMIMEKPQELMHFTLTRSMFCRNLAQNLDRSNPEEYFLMGMFSLIDAFVDRPAKELLEMMPINKNIKTAILGEENLYKEILNLVENYEAAEWHYVEEGVEKLGTKLETVAVNYYDALKWSDRI